MQEVQGHITVPAAVTAAAGGGAPVGAPRMEWCAGALTTADAFAGRNVATAATTGALPRASTPGIGAITTNAPSVLPAAKTTVSARCSWPSSGHQRLPQRQQMTARRRRHYHCSTSDLVINSSVISIALF